MANISSHRGKVLLFKTIGIFIPIIVILLLELSLRVFHYGNNLSLFVDFPENKNYLIFNPDASKKYFSNQALATIGEAEPFLKKKEAGIMRIFVLGESTTIGYPYFYNGSFHRWLQYRLAQNFPDKKFEIINLSLTAVNSYTVLGFAKEVVNYNPDAILVYSGHNEYYGCMGVASTDKIMGNSFMVNLILNLRDLRLVQLMANTYGKIAGSARNDSGGTRMKTMVADSHIPYNSELYYRGINQFSSNIDQTLNLFNKHHIPVFISNLVCNEKDLAPFVSIKNDNSKYASFEKDFNNGLNDFNNNKLNSASQYFKQANQKYNEHALCNFYLGKLAYHSGNFAQAKIYYDKAKELDGLRFRAPEEFNVVIENLCKKYPNAHLVDTKSEFETWSSNQIIGKELILDHVHPNLTGYALMSDAFYESMKKNGLMPTNEEKRLSLKQLLIQMPVTKVDSLVGIYRISFLKKTWPFTEALHQDSITISSEEEKLAWSLALNKITWEEANDRLFTYYENNNKQAEAMKVLEALILEYPRNILRYEKAAKLSSNLNDYEKAVFYFRKVFDLSPSFNTAQYIFVNDLKMDKPIEAMPYLDYVINNNNSGINFRSIKNSLQEIIRLKSLLIVNSSDLSVINKIAYNYLKMGNRDGASIYIDKALALDHKNPDALNMREQIKIKDK
jgi:tetratricopeptide (TPR) repeat protein